MTSFAVRALSVAGCLFASFAASVHADEQAGATMTIDLSAIGGPRPQVGRQTQFTLEGPARTALLDKVGSADGVVVVRDAAGAPSSKTLVPPQDIVDFAMFPACVSALETPAGA